MFDSEDFKKWHKEWQKRLESQAISKEEAHKVMKKNNPAIIPRNHRVEEALEAAVNGDNGVMEKLLGLLADPFAYSPEQGVYAELPPDSCGTYRTFCGT